MSDSVGIGGLTWLIIIAVVLAGVAFALYRWRIRPFGGSPEREDFLEEAESEGRLEVLESTPVDAQRRLVLVRCDNVEHLIMVGGPADLVVESDVRKSRTAAKGSSRPAEAPQRAAAAAAPQDHPVAAPQRAVAAPQDRAGPERAEPPAPRRSEPALPPPEAQARPERRPAEQKALPQIAPEQRGAAQENAERKQEDTKPVGERPPEGRPGEAPARFSAPSRPTLTAVPGAAIQAPGPRREQGSGAALPALAGREVRGEAATPRADESGSGRPGSLRPHAPEPQIGGRREPQLPGSKRTPSVHPAAVNGNRSDERGRTQPALGRDGPGAGERRLNGNGADAGNAAKAATLPPADVPWPEPDSIENEIVRALATESNPTQQEGGHNAAAPQAPAPAGAKSDPATTLGDLAERLEEALAREVQSANKGRSRLDTNVDTFSFDRDAAEKPAPEPRQQQAPQKDRREPPKAMAPAPEPETRPDRRPQPERQEDAPVISLHGRRREAVDPLEDEMARLLGELTGDTNRR